MIETVTLMERIIDAVNNEDRESAEALVELGNFLEACFFWTEDEEEYTPETPEPTENW